MEEYLVQISNELPGNGGLDIQEVVVHAYTPAQAAEQAVESHRLQTGDTYQVLSVYWKVWSWYDYD